MQPAYVDAYHVLTIYVLRIALRRYVSSVREMHFVNLGSIDNVRLYSAEAWLCGRLQATWQRQEGCKSQGDQCTDYRALGAAFRADWECCRRPQDWQESGITCLTPCCRNFMKVFPDACRNAYLEGGMTKY